MTGDPRSIGGLTITNTETIRSFLTAASNDPLLLQDLRKTASDLSTRPSVPYKSLRPVWFGSKPSTRPDLLRLFSGSDFVFASPKPREKSEELKARLRKLEELAERKAYDELVKDITPKKGTDEPFSSYKDQLGFESRASKTKIVISLSNQAHKLLTIWMGTTARMALIANHVEIHIFLAVTKFMTSDQRLLNWILEFVCILPSCQLKLMISHVYMSC